MMDNVNTASGCTRPSACSFSDLLDISTTELPEIGDPGITCVIGRYRIYLDFGCCDGSVLWEVTKQRSLVGKGETRDTLEAFGQCVACIKANASVSSSGGEPEYAPRTCSLSDTDRLVWLRRNVSGVEMRRIGICMDNTGDTEEFRKRIDEVVVANAQVEFSEGSEV